MATTTYALVAEFDTPEALLAAAEKTRDAGYKEIDAHSPFPIHGMGEAIGFGRPILAEAEALQLDLSLTSRDEALAWLDQRVAQEGGNKPRKKKARG